ncbi:uncharacterized protein MYCFIDRAFT_211460 [Pseudocercospora fijiensis CIRAD86]|uniref:Uncharacterized protein n=1 Tax=Pseudocercospora fijiensis (strain CIRAD86) TaxID=383855 RepID=M3AWF7_PSEFD|nr:uncharacterized protein MYCFIDRAFT_211460 [Pseudocercospora fijiensis CIRAD86]EME81797.1 hypothetical protein MYCFIDRAFT_211460 [Pseudocercospora fijiensis CIRAD86]
MFAVQWDLIELYLFANRRSIPALKNAIIDRLVQLRNDNWRPITGYPHLMRRIRASLPRNSKLCLYLVQEAAHFWDSGLFLKHRVDLHIFPKLLLEEITRAIYESRLGTEDHGPSWAADVCYFHEHDRPAQRHQCVRDHSTWQAELKRRGEYEKPDHEVPDMSWLMKIIEIRGSQRCA